MSVCIVRGQVTNLRLLVARQGTISSFPICLFLPATNISNLFELFFTQNYLHTPTLHLPHQGTICSLPTCLFCPPQVFQICLNYFLPKIFAISSLPSAINIPKQHRPFLPYMPFFARHKYFKFV